VQAAIHRELPPTIWLLDRGIAETAYSDPGRIAETATRRERERG
jgi:hypothetical protein